MGLDRGSSKHGPRLDEAMDKEVEGLIRAGHPTRVEEWHDPEPPIDIEETEEETTEETTAEAAEETGPEGA